MFGFKFYTEGILCIIHVEDQAFLPWYDLDPCRSLPPTVPSVIYLYLFQSSCASPVDMTVEGREWDGAKSYKGKTA